MLHDTEFVNRFLGLTPKAEAEREKERQRERKKKKMQIICRSKYRSQNKSEQI